MSIEGKFVSSLSTELTHIMMYVIEGLVEGTVAKNIKTINIEYFKNDKIKGPVAAILNQSSTYKKLCRKEYDSIKKSLTSLKLNQSKRLLETWVKRAISGYGVAFSRKMVNGAMRTDDKYRWLRSDSITCSTTYTIMMEVIKAGHADTEKPIRFKSMHDTSSLPQSRIPWTMSRIGLSGLLDLIESQ